MAKQNLLLLGATGYIGGYIAEQILKANASFGRIAVFTSPSTAENKPQLLDQLKEQGAEIIIGDVRNSAELLKAFEGIDTVISAVGRNVIADQIDWIKLAVQASVKRIFPSEYGTDIEYSPKSANEIPHQGKLKVRAALRDAEKDGLEHTFVVTGPYAEGFLDASRNTPELGSFDVEKKKAVVLEDGKGKVSLTTCSDVGRLVVKALLHPVESRNRALKVNSFTTTPLDIVSEFEKQTGGEKWKVEYTPLEKAREIEQQLHAEKKPWAVGMTLRRIWGEGGTLYDKRDNWIIDGEETETLEVAVHRAIAAQEQA